MGKNNGKPTKFPDEVCVWCGQMTTDGAEESGWMGQGPDPMIDGDFGCHESPETSEDGCGGHLTRTAFKFRGEGFRPKEPVAAQEQGS